MATFTMFSVNPFSTPVGQRIERATDGNLASEDWALNMEICDIINETDDGPKDAMKALRKRLQGNRNWKAVLLTLTVFETCVKNCGRRFHSFVASKDFMSELTKILSPKSNPPQIVQEKILSLIQCWADAFRGHADLQAVVQTYEHMKSQGIEFPAQDLDTLSPIYTPERSVPYQPKANNQISRPDTDSPPKQGAPSSPIQQLSALSYPTTQQPMAYPPPQQMQPAYPAQPPAGPIQPSSEQLSKLRSQLDIVEQNVKVMSEMLMEMSPGQESPDDLQLLQELNRTCRAMQTRVMELVDKVANEEVMSECLRINDDLNNIFIRYDRFERYRQASQQQTTPSAVAAQQDPRWADYTNQVPAEKAEEPKPVELQEPNAELIQFFDSDEAKPNNQDLADRLASVELKDVTLLPSSHGPREDFMLQSVAQNDEFDMFAQSRKTTFEDSRRGGSTYGDNLEAAQQSSLASAMYGRNPNPSTAPASTVDTAPSDDFQHMENWLATSDLSKPEAKENAANTNSQDSMTSSEFEKFLSERAASGGERCVNTARGPAQRPPQRQMQMTEGEEDLFGL